MATRLISSRRMLSLVYSRAIPILRTGQYVQNEQKIFCRALAVAGVVVTGYACTHNPAQADVHSSQSPVHESGKPILEIIPEKQDVINWSGTHSVTTDRFFQPETVEELRKIVKHSHEARQKLRPIGSCLSPNGLPLNSDGMVSLANLDNVLSVDTKTNRVTVQAGARVSQIVEALRPLGLTLQNYASITEQQMGGITQVGAHGTGVKIPPVDEQVVSLRMIAPGLGSNEVYLSAEDIDPSLFQLARTSLGMLGIVTELTIQCVPAHKLIERTFVLPRQQVAEQHRTLLSENRHLRYMWIPHTDDVIVVTCNPAQADDEVIPSVYSTDERLGPARHLLKSHPSCKLSDEQISSLEFPSLRDELLALDPINVKWLQKVNQAEARFWRRSQGVRIDWSDKILQFDCGGQQWVSEVVFPLSGDRKKDPDIQYMFSLLDMIEQEKIPAPGPIEQRWTAPSLSPMSPASELPTRELGEFYSWVGIIMYLPDAEADGQNRELVTKAFKKYKTQCEERLWPSVSAVEHWAKIEMPTNDKEAKALQERTMNKYPVEEFRTICALFDPHGIFRNELTDTIFGMSRVPNKE